MENITEIQKQLIEKLRKKDADVTIRWSDERGVASVLKGKLMEWKSDESPQELLNRWLRSYGQLIGSNTELNNLEYVGTTDISAQGIQIRAVQKAEGLPIYGATLLLFVDKEQGLYRVQSGLYRDPQVPPARLGTREVDFKAMEGSLAKRLRKRLEASSKGLEFSNTFKERSNLKADDYTVANFPIVDPPKLWLYPTQRGLRQAFTVYAYQPITWWGVSGEKRETIDLTTIVIDARTGRIISEGGRLGMSYTDTNGDGLSTLVDNTNSYITRPLLTVQDSTSNNFLLINRAHTPSIITHNAGGTDAGLETKFINDTDISTDTDDHWNKTTTSCTPSDRKNSQQSDTDAHFWAEQAFNFYDSLGWRGFDNGRWGTHCAVRAAVHIGLDANAYFWRYISNGKHYGYVAFYDGTCSGNTILYDFMAGDPVIFGHEYQHAITYFGARTPLGDPGYLEIVGWHRAIHEGLSDLMACLRTETWITPNVWRNGAARGGKPFRRIEYPRSTDTNNNIGYLDHFDDRNTTSDPYVRSSILSHAAYLAGQGGVHQRTSRPAELIPVVAAGTGITAKIFHHAVTTHFDNIPVNSTQGNTMIEAAQLVLDAAEDLTGTKRSTAYVMLRRAFYAVGLHPYDGNYNKITYGGEACMLPWTVAWWHSRAYLGFPALWWQSPDLFINNGSGPEYDAKVGQENKLFARVRNIGDQDIKNVSVKFYFIASGTNLPPSSTQWKECQDQNGDVCVLNIPTLAAGSMNFTDENNPPANQAVNWYLSPAEIVQGLDHFCLRADIVSDAPNNDNDCPNSVQSNISYTPLTLAEKIDLRFVVANWEREPIPIQLEINHTLPEAFKIRYAGEKSLEEIRLKPKEQMPLHWQVTVPDRPADLIGPPYDGKITAEIQGEDLSGPLTGELYDVQVSSKSVKDAIVPIEGQFSGVIRRKTRFIGTFQGKFNPNNNEIAGTLEGITYTGKRTRPNVILRLNGSLEPLRAIHIVQKIQNKQVGGISIKLKLP